MTWQLQTAKARLSELIKKTIKDGPQTITLHGEPAAVLISAKDYAQLKQSRAGLVEFMRKSPMLGIEIDLNRKQTSTRETDI